MVEDHQAWLREEKRRLRALLREHRRQLSAAAVMEKSSCILARLRTLAPCVDASILVLYSADDNEVQTEAIWQEAAAQGKTVYYPRITVDLADLEFVRRFPGERLIPGAFGILVPPGEELLTRLQARDVVLTPGVGFDVEGGRLGRGRGYYDRAFRGVLAPAVRVALAYDFQVLPRVPSGPTDEKVHFLVTETRLIVCRS
ncbi:MAG: 5-formyltetrahydrofolate cyclo-ligase [Candidatus Binatia bacterium]|nr:5-formyltetrahydrofolate cyclo-ligase [Candidatus Binatia bacterium]